MKQCPNCSSPNPDDSAQCVECGHLFTEPPKDVFVERLKTEVGLWRTEQLINEEQARMLLARYGLIHNETAATVRQSKIASIIAVLGVVLVGAGLILMMGANWQVIPKWLRFAFLFVATGASYWGGYKLAYGNTNYPKIGSALLLFGSILWGASIMLIGQMYSAGGEGGEQNTLLYWFLGVIPLAYVLRSPLHMGLSAIVGVVWFAWISQRSVEFGSSLFLLLMLIIGTMLCSLAVLHSIWKKFHQLSHPLRALGMGLVFTTIYAFSFRAFWWGFNYHSQNGSMASFIWTGAVTVISAFVAITYARKLGQTTAVFEALGTIGVLFAGVIAISIASSNGALNYGGYESTGSLGIAVFFNLVLLALEVGVISLGWYRNRAGLINLGLAAFVIQLMTRYFDTLAGMLQGGLMIALAGLLLIPVAIAIERARRRLIASSLVRRAS